MVLSPSAGRECAISSLRSENRYQAYPSRRRSHGGLKVRRIGKLLSFADVLRIEENDNLIWIIRRTKHTGVQKTSGCLRCPMALERWLSGGEVLHLMANDNQCHDPSPISRALYTADARTKSPTSQPLHQHPSPIHTALTTLVYSNNPKRCMV